MEKTGLLATGIPSIVMPLEVYERCLGWMIATDTEVSWRGLADWNEKYFYIREVFLPIQRASSGAVFVPTAKNGGDMSKWLTDCIKNGTYTDQAGNCRYKLHMHKHPGSDWEDLYESIIDEDNTDKFSIRDIDWMMVGRAVNTGKMQIDLEIFKPLRLTINNLSIFVEFNETLHQISNSDDSLTLDKEFSVQIENALLAKQIASGKEYFADVAIASDKTSSLSGILYDTDPYEVPAYRSLGRVKYCLTPSRKEMMSIMSLKDKNDVGDLFFSVKREDDAIKTRLNIRIGKWFIEIGPIATSISLPQIKHIREQSAKEVKSKVQIIKSKIPKFQKTVRNYPAMPRIRRGHGG